VRHYLGVPKFGSSEAQTARRERCTAIVNSGVVSYVDRKSEQRQHRADAGLESGVMVRGRSRRGEESSVHLI
jgi:hypothetical protein